MKRHAKYIFFLLRFPGEKIEKLEEWSMEYVRYNSFLGKKKKLERWKKAYKFIIGSIQGTY